jgi:hypothetical protein
LFGAEYSPKLIQVFVKIRLVTSLFLIKELEPNKLWDINLYKIEFSFHNAPKYQIQLRFYHCFLEQSNFLKIFHIAIYMYMKLWMHSSTMNKSQDLLFLLTSTNYHITLILHNKYFSIVRFLLLEVLYIPYFYII